MARQKKVGGWFRRYPSPRTNPPRSG
jgi:hypothetical protein